MAHQLTGKTIASTFEQLIYRSTTEPSSGTTTTQLITSENDQTDDIGLPLYISTNRVGIGTAAPGAVLSVAGDILAPSFDTNTTYKIGIADATANASVATTRGNLQIQASSAVGTANAMGGGSLTLQAGNSYVAGPSGDDGQVAIKAGYNLYSAQAETGNGGIQLYTGNAARLTVLNNGRVGINEGAPSMRLDVQDNTDAAFVARFQNQHVTGWGVLVKLGHANPDTGDPFIAFWDSTNQQEGSITTNGTNPGIVLNNPSDRRLKEDIVTIPDGLLLISKIKPRNFKWKEGDGKIAYGFIADEIDEFFPSMVQGQRDDDGKLIPDAMKEVEGELVVDRQALCTDDIIPMLVKAVQELSAKVTALENA